MPQEVILLKLGEIALKGLNRRSFEDVLLKNIRRRLQSAGEFSVSAAVHRVRGARKSPGRLGLGEERVSKVFGVVGYARAGVCEKELDAICRRAAEYLAEELETASTFKVECKRSDKKFPYKSPEVSAQVGRRTCWRSSPTSQVDVHHPDPDRPGGGAGDVRLCPRRRQARRRGHPRGDRRKGGGAHQRRAGTAPWPPG